MASPRSPAVPWGLLWGKPGAPVTVRTPLASPQRPAPCLLTISDLQGPHPGPGRRQREPDNRGPANRGPGLFTGCGRGEGDQRGEREHHRLDTALAATPTNHRQEHPQRDPGLQGRAAHLGRNPHTHTHTLSHILGFPGGTSGKELACQCRRHRRHGFDPWVRKIPLDSCYFCG